MKKRGLQGIQQAEELNITAFLNLMVILVPFLLITAVFSRLTVLELNLPALDAKGETSAKVKLQLELVIREHSFDIQDANIGLIKKIERTQKANQWKQFTDAMVAIKTRFPDESSISLLLEPDVDYKTMIKVMDKVRSAQVVTGFEAVTVVLFPDISIGDAQVIVTGVVTDETVAAEANVASGRASEQSTQE
ncbi:ExbD/TolR family protein [Colwellia psychrerythraea]|uniref:Biopolymer transport protein ExbD/TolR n=1 Tax=Colwellia psychrerythraea TaxID=28229 RepID=A0A099KY39_COLPS|nr:biopolymer transporter ExbD [Colwellia psychrerythraea]KGJ94802.1 Biopolymer transport protein ExbD/TolR [Colwellia psychrerythraea]